MEGLNPREQDKVNRILKHQPVVANRKTGAMYRRVGYLGKGQFGWVWKVIDQKGYVYAMKDLRITKDGKSKSFWKAVTSEIDILKKLNHKHIIQLVDDFADETDYHMVTSFCDGGNMEDRIYNQQYANKGLPEKVAIKYLMQMMFALKELHQCKIIHRDIKLANMFLHNDDIIIGDFGFAKHDVDSHFSKIGTPYYMAPEVISKKPEDMYSNKCDLWSVGVCFYFVLFGNLPFPAKTEQELLNMIQNRSGKNLHFRKDKKIGLLTRNILVRLIEPDPKKRLSFPDFFGHQIFTMFCQENGLGMPTTFKRTPHDTMHIGYKPNPKDFVMPKGGNLFGNQQGGFHGGSRATPSFANNSKNSSKMYQELSASMRIESSDVSSQYDSQTSNYDLLEENLYDKAYGPYFFEKNLVIFLLETSKKLRLLCDIKYLRSNPSMQFTAFVGAYLVARLTENIAGKVAKSMMMKYNVFQIPNFEALVKKEDFQIINEFFAQAHEFSGNYKQQIREQISAKFPSNSAQISREAGKMDHMRTDDLKREMNNCLKGFSKFYFKQRDSMPSAQRKHYAKSFIWLHLVLQMEKHFKVPQFIYSAAWKRFEENMLMQTLSQDEQCIKAYL